jgi:hypothetical protein
MATITSNTFLDDGVARTAGEAMAIGNGAIFTIRTDSRIHANAPASFTGSLGSPTFTGIGGEFVIDATNVRWLAYNSGTGVVPPIGTSIVGNTSGATGYLLGVWAPESGTYPTTTWPTVVRAVGAAMPTSGFIKLREVSGGPYNASETLTGIGASTTAADVTGWIEVAFDAGTNFVVGRVGKFKTRGDWFYLENTQDGQDIQVPSSIAAGAAHSSYPLGAWVETSPGTDEYEFWPCLHSGLINMSNFGDLWGEFEVDRNPRAKFLTPNGAGTFGFGASTYSDAPTYTSVAAQVGTYAGIAIAGTYTWAADVVTVNTAATAHLLEDGQTIGLDFTSGSGVDAATFVVNVIDAFNFSCAYVGSGTGGNVTVRPGVTITFTAHGLNQGEDVYCDFTSGTGVDGTYQVYSVGSANAYSVSYPHTAALTGGNVSCIHSIDITYTSHGLAQGRRISIRSPITGAITGGHYVVKSAPTANTLRINHPSSTIISGTCRVGNTLTYQPPAGCKVRVPNIFLQECATATRAVNSQPNGTVTSRPEFTTTTAGAIDIEYLYSFSLRSVFAQPYSVRIHHSCLQESLDISECATAIDINDVGIGHWSSQDVRSLQLTSNFAGGTISNVVAPRVSLGTTDHATEIIYCKDLVIENLNTGITGYIRSTGIPLNIQTCSNLTIDGVKVFNGNISIATSNGVYISNIDYNDRYAGYTSITTPLNAVVIGAGCNDIIIDGMTFGLGGTVPNCQPYTGLVSITGASNVKIRNLGTSSNYLSTGEWAPNLVATGVVHTSGGNNSNISIQKVFVNKMRTGLVSTINSDKNVLYEQILSSDPCLHSAKAAYISLVASLDTDIKGMTTGGYPVTAQVSVYGTHWYDMFLGTAYGALILAMNEPTTDTSPYYTNNAGIVKFNSSGGVEMRAIGATSTWETPYYIQGHTGFQNVSPVMSGGTIGNYRFKYQIDLNDGNSWSTLSAQLTAAQLATALNGEIVDPVDGFKLRIQIETTTGNATAITFLRIYTTTSTAAQNAINYPLDIVPITVTVKDVNTGDPIENARVFIEAAAGGPATLGTDILTGLTNASGILTGTTEYVDQPISGRVRRASVAYGTLYKSATISSTIESDGLNLTVLMIPDE